MSFISRFGISGAMRGEQNQWLHPTEPEIASVPEQSTFFFHIEKEMRILRTV